MIVSEPTVNVGHPLFLNWLHIATKHCIESIMYAERLDEKGFRTDYADFDHLLMERELEEAIVTITSMAFAFEALYNEIRRHAIDTVSTARKIGARHAARRIADILCRTLHNEESQCKDIRNYLGQLFVYRNRAVHYSVDTSKTMYHPRQHRYNFRVAEPFHMFHAKSASNACKNGLRTFLLICDEAKRIEAQWASGCKAAYPRIKEFSNRVERVAKF